MRLNIGAGCKRIPGYTGVDAVPRPAADIVAPADVIPLPDGSVEEVLAIHLLEHVYVWDAPELLREWARLLQPSGLLVLELPDIVKCARNIVDGRMKGGKDPDQLGMWGIYGDPRSQDTWMNHKWGYTFKTLTPMVAAAGFVKIVEKPTQFHPAGREFRDFRLEARKG